MDVGLEQELLLLVAAALYFWRGRAAHLYLRWLKSYFDLGGKNGKSVPPLLPLRVF